jgi:hypothetical protein
LPLAGRHVFVWPFADLMAAGRVVTEGKFAVNLAFIISFIVAGLAVVGVFIDIPMVSNYAFWFAIAAYIILASSK